MKILLNGSRFECKRDSLYVGSSEEMYGPPVAVPFKWEESPGKAKPVEKDSALQIEGGDEFYNMLLTKEGSMGRSSGSLYKAVTHGNVPFHWEDEPGKPKTPAREEKEHSTLAPLSPPPCIQLAGYTNSTCTVQRPSKMGSKWFAKKTMKSIFQGIFVGVSRGSSVSKPGREDDNGNSKDRSCDESANSFHSAGSDELGVSKSINRNGSSSIKSSTVDDSSEYFSNDEPCRISDATPKCFARCPVPLPRSLSRSRNSVKDQNCSPLDLKNAYFSVVMCMRQSSKKNSIVVVDTEESLHHQQEGGSEFQDAVTDFVTVDESCEDQSNSNSNLETSGELNDGSSASQRANATVMEAELLRRLAQEDAKLEMTINRQFHSEMTGVIFACLPLYSLTRARWPKVHKDPEQRWT